MSYLFSKCDHTIGSELEFSGSLSKGVLYSSRFPMVEIHLCAKRKHA